jgi:hypothetical protein
MMNDEKGSRCDVKPPKEFQIPEGKKAGDEFDVVCTFRIEDDGTLCLTKLGETDMPTEKAESTAKPAYEAEAQEAVAGMGMGQGEEA